MAISYKPEQQAIIDENNKNQLVSASAGSGKTTIMIQKIIDLITKKHFNIKNILVLTYTNASAEEMKQKLISKIYEEVETNPELLSQVDQVPLSDISTLHSFFQKVIKKYFMVLGINPSFELLDENGGAKFQNKAKEEALKEFQKQKPEQFDSILDVFGKTRNTDTLKEVMTTLNNFLLSVPNKEEWCKNVATKLYDKKLNLGKEILNKELVIVAQYYVEAFKHFQDVAEGYGEDKIVAMLNIGLGVLTLVKDDVSCFEKNCELWCNIPTMTLPKKCEVVGLKEIIGFVKTNMTNYAKKIKKWGFQKKEVLEKQLDEMKGVVEALCEITLLYQNKYAEIKKEKNVFDFDDLEKYMLKLIENKKICDELRNSYDKIFVDEYQDANRIQEKILLAICKDNNRFMVGDVKQSIYGFRQAEPDIFLETMDDFSDNEKSVVGFLNYNFRSHKKILNFVNIVFEKIMTEQTGKIDYKNSSIFKWDEKYQDVPNQKLKNVEIDIIKMPEKPEKIAPEKMYSVKDENLNQQEYGVAEVEAFFVAKKIDELLDKKIFVAKEGIFRKIEYKDITILLRSRGGYLTPFSKMLTGLGVPLFANTSESLFCDSDVMTLLNVAKLSLNFKDDVALVSVMHSVFGGNFSFDELAKIRMNGNDREQFFECVEKYDKQDEILEKIKTLKNNLEDFACKFENQGGFLTYSELIDKTKFLELVLRKKNGLQKAECVKKFVSNFLNNGFNFDLCGFVEFVNNNKEDIKAPDFLGGENCVSITTMHSSKGLEYPVVIMANTNQNFMKEAKESPIKINQNLGVGMSYYDSENRIKETSLPLEVIKKVNKDNDFAEKLRLLYVAMTRPQNHLIIVGATPKLDFKPLKNDFDVKRQNSYLQLVVGALKEEDVESVNLGQSVQTEDYEVNVMEALSEKDFDKAKVNKANNINKKMVEEFKKYFEYSYPKSEQKLMVKNSVSELRKFFDEKVGQEDELPKTKQNDMAELGTLYHKVLELIDFEKIETLEDVEMFLKGINGGEKIEAKKVLKAIELIKTFEAEKYLKEQEFVMNLPTTFFGNDNEKDVVVVKGIVDLVVKGKKNVLIDYKFSNISDENELISAYKMQLELYQKALELSGFIRVDKRFLLLINSGKLVEI